MSIAFDRFVTPFAKAWSLVGRSLVVDATGRQVVRPVSDLSSADWASEKADWERLAPLFAEAVPLYEQAETLAVRLEGDGVRRVDGRIVVEEDDFAGLLDVLARIRAAMPKPQDPDADVADAPSP